MPWTPAQHRLFEAAAHDPHIAAQRGIPMRTAAHMAHEGIKGYADGGAQDPTSGLPTPEYPAPPPSSALDKLYGMGEAGLSYATAPYGMIAGGVSALAHRAVGDEPFQSAYDRVSRENTYEPKTREGQYYSGKLGDLLSNVPPVLPELGGLAAASEPVRDFFPAGSGDANFARESGAVNPKGDFFGLRANVPLQPVTGYKAASVLRGQDTQSAQTFLDQMKKATEQGARGQALRAIQENAIRNLTGGDRNAPVSKTDLQAQLGSPLQLARVQLRQDLLPEKWQRKFGMANETAGVGDDFQPNEDWVRDRTDEILNEMRYDDSGPDPGDITRGVARDLDDYIRAPEREAGSVTNPYNRHKDYGSMLGAFMDNEGVPIKSTGGGPYQESLRLEGGEGRGQESDTPEIRRHDLTIDAIRHARMIRAMVNDEPEEAAHHGMVLGYETESPEFKDLHANLADVGDFERYINDHYGNWRDIPSGWEGSPLYENHRDIVQEEHDQNFDESNYPDARDQAEREAREQGEGDWTGGTPGEYTPADPYAYDMQRLVNIHDPDLYTQQNVFSFNPTGASLTKANSTGKAYRMDNTPPEVVSATADALQRKIEGLEKKADTLSGDDRYRVLNNISSYKTHLDLLNKQLRDPGSAVLASHFPAFTPPDVRGKYLGHFRGSMLDTNGNPFIMEEGQSDLAQTLSRMGIPQTSSMQDSAAQIGTAAMHHAAQQGAGSFHIPFAEAINPMRGKDFSQLYDKEYPKQLLAPFAQHYGLRVQEGSLRGSNGEVPTRFVDLPPEVREDMLNKGIPYAQGGPFRMMEGIRSAPSAPTINDQSIAHIRRVPGQVKPLRFDEGGLVGQGAAPQDARTLALLTKIQEAVNANS